MSNPYTEEYFAELDKNVEKTKADKLARALSNDSDKWVKAANKAGLIVNHVHSIS